MPENKQQQNSRVNPDVARQSPPSELDEAEDNLRQYVALAIRVWERLERDPEAMARFEALTASRREFRMKEKRPPTDPSHKE